MWVVNSKANVLLFYFYSASASRIFCLQWISSWLFWQLFTGSSRYSNAGAQLCSMNALGVPTTDTPSPPPTLTHIHTHLRQWYRLCLWCCVSLPVKKTPELSWALCCSNRLNMSKTIWVNILTRLEVKADVNVAASTRCEHAKLAWTIFSHGKPVAYFSVGRECSSGASWRALQSTCVHWARGCCGDEQVYSS